MIKFIRELRRREVFRTVGLYVGIAWILVEASSVVLPTFGAPQWVLRGLIVAVIVGCPITAVLAWVYSITDGKIVVDAAPADAVVPSLGSRKMDFIVIGVLGAALGLSMYLNAARGWRTGIEPSADGKPVSVLIADFQNTTGEPRARGLLELALAIDLERARYVVSLDRHAARSIAERLSPGVEGLSADIAERVAREMGARLVLYGSVETNGQRLRIRLRGHYLSNENEPDLEAVVTSGDDIFAAVGRLAQDVRRALGDEPEGNEAGQREGDFSAASIAAAEAFSDASRLADEGEHEAAIAGYKEATERDPNFGRAFAAQALSEAALGRLDAAAASWDRAVSLLDTMTERERLRAFGLYYTDAVHDYERAATSFSELVANYPADVVGHSGVAAAKLRALDFRAAAAERKWILEVYPNSPGYRSDYALAAMYASELETAAAEATAVLEEHRDQSTAYLPLASGLLASGDYAGAAETYRRMAAEAVTADDRSRAALGLADVEIYTGKLNEARETLLSGLDEDVEGSAAEAAAAKQIALGDAFAAAGDSARATEAAETALGLSNRSSVKIAAALVFLKAGAHTSAAAISDQLDAEPDAPSRAYGLMIDAAIKRESQEHLVAIRSLRSAVALADLWRIRYELGRAYLDAGFFAESFDELKSCLARRGEAAAMFLDDMPTFRVLADLPYWLARAQDGLNMRRAAVASYESFLSLRPEGGPLAEDALRRIQ